MRRTGPSFSTVTFWLAIAARGADTSSMAAGEAGLKDGRYVLVRKLGHGAQGSTFEAVDGREGRLVAIKRFDVKGAAKWKDVELAEREARVLAFISHPLLPA